MLFELCSRRLFRHNIRDVLACVDVSKHDDLALYAFLKKFNLDGDVLDRLVRKVVSCSNCQSCRVVNPHTRAVNSSLVGLMTLKIK